MKHKRFRTGPHRTYSDPQSQADCSRPRFTGNTCNDAYCPRHEPATYATHRSKHNKAGV